LLEAIICESHVNTNATVLSICEELGKLEQHMVSFSSNIEQPNNCAISQLDALTAHGETMNDLLAQSLGGHEAAWDKTFCDCTTKKKERRRMIVRKASQCCASI